MQGRKRRIVARLDPVNLAVVVEACEDSGTEGDLSLVWVAHGLDGHRVVRAREPIDTAPRAHEREHPKEAVEVRRHENLVRQPSAGSRRGPEWWGVSRTPRSLTRGRGRVRLRSGGDAPTQSGTAAGGMRTLSEPWRFFGAERYSSSIGSFHSRTRWRSSVRCKTRQTCCCSSGD